MRDLSICSKDFYGDREAFRFGLPGVPDSVKITATASGMLCLTDYTDEKMPRVIKVMTSIDQVVATIQSLVSGILCTSMI